MTRTVLVVGARGVPDVEGGAEKGAEATFPLIAESGYRVVLVGLSRYIRAPQFRGVELRKAPEFRLLKTDKLAYYLYAVTIALRLKPDIVHLQGLGSAILLWAYKLLGFKTVVRYGSADYLLDKWGFFGRLGFLASEWQLRFADAVIAVAPALRDRLRSRGIEGNVHVLPNAVDEAPPLTDEVFAHPQYGALLRQPFVLTVGRVTVQKNMHNLIQGFRAWKAGSGLPHRLVIAGGLDDVEYVKSLEPLLGEDVVLLGRLPRSELGPLYARCSVFINSSIHEGSSNAVLEAMSWRSPLLVSDIPENRDFGLPDRHYFDPLEPDAIARALDGALTSPESFVARVEDRLTWREVAQRTTAIYQQITTPSKPRLRPSEVTP